MCGLTHLRVSPLGSIFITYLNICPSLHFTVTAFTFILHPQHYICNNNDNNNNDSCFKTNNPVWGFLTDTHLWFKFQSLIGTLLLNTIASFTERQKNTCLGDMVTWQLHISGFNLMSTRTAADVRQCERGGQKLGKASRREVVKAKSSDKIESRNCKWLIHDTILRSTGWVPKRVSTKRSTQPSPPFLTPQ